MKIVVYGPDKRTGVLNGDLIIDIGGAIAKQNNSLRVEKLLKSA